MAKAQFLVQNITGVVVVSFRESALLDALQIKELGEDLYPLIDERAHRKIVLNLRRVKYMSSSMIGVLLSMHKKVQAIQGRLVLCGVRPEIAKVLKVMRLNKIIDCYQEEADAVNSFNPLS